MKVTKQTAKYPKALASAETQPKNRQSDKTIYDADQEKKQLQIKELDKSVFELLGAFPYLFDTVNYACTHHREVIQREDNKKETHYRIPLLWDTFMDYALDGYTGSGNAQRFKNEIYKMIKTPPVKVVPLDADHSIRTQLIRIDMVYEDGTKPAQYKNLKHATGKKIKGIVLEFYKPIWKGLLQGKSARAWFLAPKAFNAKMYHAIEQYRDLPEFTNYGNLTYAIDYRRLFLYLNMHDNQKGAFIHYDALELVRACFPSNTRKDRNGEIRIRNWYELHKFVQKGLRLINKMSQQKLMEGIKLIPSSVFYEKPAKTIRVKFKREQPIPYFQNETPYLPDGKRKPNT